MIGDFTQTYATYPGGACCINKSVHPICGMWAINGGPHALYIAGIWVYMDIRSTLRIFVCPICNVSLYVCQWVYIVMTGVIYNMPPRDANSCIDYPYKCPPFVGLILSPVHSGWAVSFTPQT